MFRASNDRRLIPWQKANTETWQGGTNFRQFRELLKGTIHKSAHTHTDFVFASELLFRHTYLCAVWKWYMALSFREVKECGPSSLNNISSPVCPGPVLMTSSLHRNALKQKAARGRAHFISRSLFLSHSIPISFWKDPSIIYPPFPLLGKNSPFSFFVCVSYVHCIFFLMFFLTGIHQLPLC